MEFLEITDEFSINTEFIKAIQKSENGLTRVYIDLGEEINYVISDLPYNVLMEIIQYRSKSKEPKIPESFLTMKRNIEQLARYQGTPTP